MKHYKYTTVEATPVTNYNSKGTMIRVLIPKDEAPHFIMRRFEVAPGGSIGVHSHPEEHEIFVLEGELAVIDGAGKREKVVANEFVFVPSNEPHGYANEGKKPAAFLCVIPK
nr:cupin domain-containing protein [Candidatus Sigynarchaeota archaeon]